LEKDCRLRAFAGKSARGPVEGSHTGFQATRAPAPGPFSHLSRAPAATPAGSRRGRQRLIVQLAFWFAVLALAPLCVTSYFTYRYAASGFLEDSEANLRALVTRQANEVRLYFWQAKDEITLLSGSPVLRPVLITAANLTGDNYAQYPDSDLFANIEKTWGPRMDNYVHELTFDQIYLINNHGVVVYSAGHSGHVFANLETRPTTSSPSPRFFSRCSKSALSALLA